MADSKRDIKNLSRLCTILTLAKSSYVLRMINNNHYEIENNKVNKNKLIESAGKGFEDYFSEDTLKYCVSLPEMKKICEYKEIKPYTLQEVNDLVSSVSFKKKNNDLSYMNMMSSVLQKIEGKKNEISVLKNRLDETLSKIQQNEISSAQEFIELSKTAGNSKPSNTVNQLIKIVNDHKNQVQESRDAPKKIERSEKQQDRLIDQRNVVLETKENNQHLQLMYGVLQTLKIGNKAAMEILQYNTDLQNDVQTSWREAFSMQQKIDDAIASRSSNSSPNLRALGSETKPDIHNSELPQFPNVPDHNPSIDIVSKKETQTKVKIAG